jgi:hypothetical protein
LVECIHDGRKPLLNPEQAYHVLEIMLKARESGRDGEAKQIESSFPKLQFEHVDVDARGEHLVHDRTHRREG